MSVILLDEEHLKSEIRALNYYVNKGTYNIDIVVALVDEIKEIADGLKELQDKVEKEMDK